ncbi:MAG TPA: tetratricopeptide repeat protein [Ignavibacteria bacterium]|nr:tetratricopeptide repeat protein [Ignavibacteria bacterium]
MPLSLSDDYDLAEELKNKARQYYENNKFDLSLELIEKSLIIYKKLNAYEKIQECLLLIAVNYSGKSEFSKALVILDECEKLCIKHELNEGLMKTYNSKGNNLAYLINYEHATVAFENSLKIAKSLYNQKSIITSSLNLLTIYTILKNYKKALIVINESYRILKGTDNKELFSKFLEKIALLFYDMKMYDKSFEIYATLNNYLENEKNELRLSNIMLYIGLIYYTKEKYENALIYYENSYNLKEKLKIDFIKVVYFLNLGNTHLKLGNLEKAEIYFNKFLSEPNENQLYFGMLHESLAELNLKLKNGEKVKENYYKSLEIFYSIERVDKISEISIKLSNYLTDNSETNEAINILESALKLCEKKSHFIELINLCEEFIKIYNIQKNFERVKFYENKLNYLKLIKQKKVQKAEDEIKNLINDINSLNLEI